MSTFLTILASACDNRDYLRLQIVTSLLLEQVTKVMVRDSYLHSTPEVMNHGSNFLSKDLSLRRRYMACGMCVYRNRTMVVSGLRREECEYGV